MTDHASALVGEVNPRDPYATVALEDIAVPEAVRIRVSQIEASLADVRPLLAQKAREMRSALNIWRHWEGVTRFQSAAVPSEEGDVQLAMRSIAHALKDKALPEAKLLLNMTLAAMEKNFQALRQHQQSRWDHFKEFAWHARLA